MTLWLYLQRHLEPHFWEHWDAATLGHIQGNFGGWCLGNNNCWRGINTLGYSSSDICWMGNAKTSFIGVLTSFVLPEQTEIHGGEHRGSQDPLTPPTAPQWVPKPHEQINPLLHTDPANHWGEFSSTEAQAEIYKIFLAHLQHICSGLWFRARCQGVTWAAFQGPTENRELLHSGIMLI